MTRYTTNIGDRYTDETGTGYIAIGLEEDGLPTLTEELTPAELLRDAKNLSLNDGRLYDDFETRFTPTPPTDDSNATLAAYKALAARITAHHNTLSPLEQILDGNGVHQWQQTARDEYAEYLAADTALKNLQATTATALEDAARKRNQTIANMVSILGSQPAAAKALGIDQSRISRAIAALRAPEPNS